MHQGTHLVGQARFRNGRQIVRLARRHLFAHARDGRQRTTDDPPDDEHQYRRHQRNRAHRAQRQAAGHALAHGHVLGDLHGLGTGLHGEDAVSRTVRLYIRKAQHGALRQFRARDRTEDLHAVRRPYLHHHVVVDGVGRQGLRMVGQRRAGAQRQGHLLHVIVENLVGVVQGAAVGDRGLRQGRHDDGRQQKPQQAAAQRMRHRDLHPHALGTM
ncbi:hypothetical protein D3C72_1699860 [compost metagenome]